MLMTRRQHPHRRRRWRLGRLDRGRRTAGRARARPVRGRARPATAAAGPNRRSPTPTWCSAASTRSGFAGGQMTLDTEAATTAVDRARHRVRLCDASNDGRGHLRCGQLQDGAGDPDDHGVARHRTARLCPGRVRRRRPDARGVPGAGTGHQRDHRAALPRRVLGVGHAADPDPRTSPSRTSAWTPISTPPTWRQNLADGWRTTRPRPWRGGSAARAPHVAHAVDIRYAAAGVHPDGAAGERRPSPPDEDFLKASPNGSPRCTKAVTATPIWAHRSNW